MFPLSLLSSKIPGKLINAGSLMPVTGGWSAPRNADQPPSLPHPLGKSPWLSCWEPPLPTAVSVAWQSREPPALPLSQRDSWVTWAKWNQSDSLQWQNHRSKPMTESNWEASPLKRLPCRPAAGALPGHPADFVSHPHSQISVSTPISQSLCLLLQLENSIWL